jgi:hypothetical protein
MQEDRPVIVSVFVRRLKEGHTFAEFVAEWGGLVST